MRFVISSELPLEYYVDVGCNQLHDELSVVRVLFAVGSLSRANCVCFDESLVPH